MRYTTRKTLLVAVLISAANAAMASDPELDRLALREYYANRFPQIALAEHKNGVYAIDANAREQWLEMEDFPPYEIAVDEGVELFETPFANGLGYGECFADDGAVKHHYPYFDEKRGMVITLALAVNDCRSDNGEASLEYDGQELMNLIAYMAYASRGHLVAVDAPTSEAARKAYEAGKRFYTTRRGQLNFACSSCHVQLVGNRLRAERLSASLGHVTHWPVYRFKWEQVGGLHKRFAECNSQVGAEPFAAQGDTYRNLEYFLSYLSNGLELNGPATRK
jgi:sulfur-oxidizing protein SoxA